VVVSCREKTVLRLLDEYFRQGEVHMTTEQKRPNEDEEINEEIDEPSEEEIEREKRKEQTWKHDDDKELTGPDVKF
jgi:hypothetical protein